MLFTSEKTRCQRVASSLVYNFGQGLFDVFSLQASHSEKVSQLMNQYGNLPMDLADASIVVLAEHIGHGRIFSVDQRDFNIYRWNDTCTFQNLLLAT